MVTLLSYFVYANTITDIAEKATWLIIIHFCQYLHIPFWYPDKSIPTIEWHKLDIRPDSRSLSDDGIIGISSYRTPAKVR